MYYLIFRFALVPSNLLLSSILKHGKSIIKRKIKFSHIGRCILGNKKLDAATVLQALLPLITKSLNFKKVLPSWHFLGIKFEKFQTSYLTGYEFCQKLVADKVHFLNPSGSMSFRITGAQIA